MKTTSILLMGTFIPHALARNFRNKKLIDQKVIDVSFDCFDTIPMKRDDLMASDECEGACNEEGNCSGYEFIEGENCTLFFGKMIPDAGRNLRKRSRRLMPPSINHFCKRKENSELSASALHFSCISGDSVVKERPNLNRCKKFCDNRRCNGYRYIDNMCTIYGVQKLMKAEKRQTEVCEKRSNAATNLSEPEKSVELVIAPSRSFDSTEANCPCWYDQGGYDTGYDMLVLRDVVNGVISGDYLLDATKSCNMEDHDQLGIYYKEHEDDNEYSHFRVDLVSSTCTGGFEKSLDKTSSGLCINQLVDACKQLQPRCPCFDEETIHVANSIFTFDRCNEVSGVIGIEFSGNGSPWFEVGPHSSQGSQQSSCRMSGIQTAISSEEDKACREIINTFC